MMRQIRLPYGHESRTIAVPEENLAWVEGPKHAPPVADLAEAVRSAIRNPIGSPSLSELVLKHGKRTLILVDDGTRSTPQALILPILLDELNAAGVADGDISVMVALGTHRRMNWDELMARVGEAVFNRVTVGNLSQKPEDFVDMGVSPLGIPIHVSRQYLESELSIAVGNIIPHMYAGWAGGAKMVQPGVTSAVTTGRTHLIAGPRVYEILGQVDNPVRQEMEEIAIRSGLKFIVNVVLGASGKWPPWWRGMWSKPIARASRLPAPSTPWSWKKGPTSWWRVPTPPTAICGKASSPSTTAAWWSRTTAR